VLHQRVDVLDDDRQLGLQLRGDKLAPEHARYGPLLVDDVLAEQHGLLLQVLDFRQQLFVGLLQRERVT